MKKLSFFVILLVVAFTSEGKLFGQLSDKNSKDRDSEIQPGNQVQHNLVDGEGDGEGKGHRIDNGGLISNHLTKLTDKLRSHLLGRKDGHEDHLMKGQEDLKINKEWNHEAIDKEPKEEDEQTSISVDQHADEESLTNSEEAEDAQHFFHTLSSDEFTHDLDDDDDDDEYEDSADNDEELVRCKRPTCNETLSCPFGPKTDSKGCSICECLKDPCQGYSCEVGYACDIEECLPKRKCDALGFRCMRKHCNGPTPMCSNMCEHGYALNEEGCDTCVCRLPPFPQNHKIDNDGIDSDDDTYNDSAPYDDDRDDNDKDYYDFIDKESAASDSDESDDEDEDEEFYNMLEDREASFCGNSCSKSHFCDPVQRDCKKRTKCWVEKEYSSLMQSDPLSVPSLSFEKSCEPSLWRYQPMQCNDRNRKKCWCVDALGRMIEGTLTYVINKEQEPICKERLIESITFVLDFAILSEGTGKGRLNQHILNKLAAISTARKIDINLSKYLLNDDLMTYHVTLKYSNMYDIGYAAVALSLYTGMHFDSSEFKVRQQGSAKVTEVQEYQKTVHQVPWKNLIGVEFPPKHVVHSHHSLRIVLFIAFVVMAATIFVLLVLMVYRLYQRRGTIRHHALPTNLPSTLDPSKLVHSTKRDDKVLLVENDVIDRTRVV